jgi:AAA ATPase domain
LEAPDRPAIPEDPIWHIARHRPPVGWILSFVALQPSTDLIGRERLLGRLGSQLERVRAGQRSTVLVAGEAGIGKTSLVRVATTAAAEWGARIAWGTCIDLEGAPGYWPWSQALDGLVRSADPSAPGRMLGDDIELLASIIPSLAAGPLGPTSERHRLLLMDATRRFLDSAAADGPLIIVLDDLQWADESTLTLLDFVARAPQSAPVGMIGLYRNDELGPASRRQLGDLLTRAEHIQVDGLGHDGVRQLVERSIGSPVDAATAHAIHRRTGGHPFFVRELALFASHEGSAEAQIPSAVLDAIERRVARLSEPTIAVLEAAALTGLDVQLDVAASVLGRTPPEVEAACAEAIGAGLLTATGAGCARFSHDLLRETVLARIDHTRRIRLHQAIGSALEARLSRGGEAVASDLAHHFIVAIPIDGPDRAVHWALRAAACDCAALAFAEAAGHLRRLRSAVASAALDLDGAQLVDVLMAEADALACDGRIVDARGLLRHAADVATRAADAGRIAGVALATAELGARFAMRRDEVIRDLERARAMVEGKDVMWEARLTAGLARELQHSVAEDRPRACALSEQALALGRRAGDPVTLLGCLLARHDVLWTPGTGEQRAAIAQEIIDTSVLAGDDARQAEGLLLLANALLEQGSAAYDAALRRCLALLDAQGQARHRYVAETRRACVALMLGNLVEAERRIEAAATLGDRIREPDTGNVRMSQRLELVRARAEPDELRAFAADAIAHWTGAPVHARAVAAGFHARAGDLDLARHHIVAVVDLGSWRADRSYLWSVFTRELARAAVALADLDLCRQLLADLRPLALTCGVNGAVVAFAGSHGHTAGLLAATLGDIPLADRLLNQAAETYRRLQAASWLAELDTWRGEEPAHRQVASLRRLGAAHWQVTFAGAEATVAHSKGLSDLARLVASPGVDVHVLDLADAGDRSGATGDLTDRQALAAYRQRLADLESDAAEAERHHDAERRSRIELERQALLHHIGQAAGADHRPRRFANHPAERGRKAVSARIRDTIRRLAPVMPDLASHLDASIVTGTWCRYRPDSAVAWHVDVTPPGNPTGSARPQ